MRILAPEELRQAMARFATGVTVISTWNADGRVHGMTANAFASISLRPPLVLVCVGHERTTYRNLQQQDRFGVNILAHDQAAVARRYARSDKNDVTEPLVTWHTQDGRSPEIDGALAFLQCRVVATHEYGDHILLIAEVEEVEVRDGQPLLFYASQLWPFRTGDQR